MRAEVIVDGDASLRVKFYTVSVELHREQALCLQQGVRQEAPEAKEDLNPFTTLSASQSTILCSTGMVRAT